MDDLLDAVLETGVLPREIGVVIVETWYGEHPGPYGYRFLRFTGEGGVEALNPETVEMYADAWGREHTDALRINEFVGEGGYNGWETVAVWSRRSGWKWLR